MFKRLIVIAIAIAFASAIGYADQSPRKLILPVDRTNPTDGKQMYSSYCAPCHGIDGRGHGYATSALARQPVDLTTLARSNRGKFPDTHVFTVLQFGPDMRGHASSQMPAWGPILGKINHVNPLDKELRMSNLSRYLEHLQVK